MYHTILLYNIKHHITTSLCTKVIFSTFKDITRVSIVPSNSKDKVKFACNFPFDYTSIFRLPATYTYI